MDEFYRCAMTLCVMKQKQFERMLIYFHCVNNKLLLIDKQSPQYDKIRKVWWLIEGFICKCLELFNLDIYIVVDEFMVAQKGYSIQIHQYIKEKPTKYGMKIWVVVYNSNKYIQPSNLSQEGREDKFKIKVQHCLDIDEGLEHKGHIIVMDNHFT